MKKFMLLTACYFGVLANIEGMNRKALLTEIQKEDISVPKDHLLFNCSGVTKSFICSDPEKMIGILLHLSSESKGEPMINEKIAMEHELKSENLVEEKPLKEEVFSCSDLSDMLSVNLSSIDPRSDMSEKSKQEASILINELLVEIKEKISDKQSFKPFRSSLLYAHSLGILGDSFLTKIKECYDNDENYIQKWQEEVDDECGY